MWQNGDLYEQYVGRWSRLVASRFLAWLDVPARRHWLDVGCGTGALTEAILEQCAPASVIGVEPSQGYLERAHARLAERASLQPGSADALPLGDSRVDVTCSGLVLNFVPDADAALSEMARVTVDGGTIGVYLWDYAGKMELMRHFWDAARALDPRAASADEGVRFPLCRPDALHGVFERAGLRSIEQTEIVVDTPFASFEAYWRPFLGGQGPAPAYAVALDDGERTRLREELRRRVPIDADGGIALAARAWAIRGRVDKAARRTPTTAAP